MKKILFIVSCIAMTGVMNVDAKKKTKNVRINLGIILNVFLIPNLIILYKPIPLFS